MSESIGEVSSTVTVVYLSTTISGVMPVAFIRIVHVTTELDPSPGEYDV